MPPRLSRTDGYICRSAIEHLKVHGIDNLRHQRKGARLGGNIIRQKHTAMTTRLASLSNDCVATTVFEPACFVHRGCSAEHQTAGCFHAFKECRSG